MYSRYRIVIRLFNIIIPHILCTAVYNYWCNFFQHLTGICTELYVTTKGARHLNTIRLKIRYCVMCSEHALRLLRYLLSIDPRQYGACFASVNVTSSAKR